MSARQHIWSLHLKWTPRKRARVSFLNPRNPRIGIEYKALQSNFQDAEFIFVIWIEALKLNVPLHLLLYVYHHIRASTEQYWSLTSSERRELIRAIQGSSLQLCCYFRKESGKSRRNWYGAGGQAYTIDENDNQWKSINIDVNESIDISNRSPIDEWKFCDLSLIFIDFQC